MISLLYVDDEPALLDLGKLYLEKGGEFAVDVIASAGNALGLLDKKGYDAIISDYQMPGMDGIALLKEVRRRGNTVPFILFTGRGREEIVIQALNEGADFYLQKGGAPSAQFAELAHKVRHAVQRRRAEESIRFHERREADILSFLPDATFAIDKEGVVIAWNQAMEELTGVRAAEVLGKGDQVYSLYVYRERRPMLIDLILEADEATEKERYLYTRRNDRMLTAEAVYNKPDGTLVHLWGKASRLYDEAGNLAGAIESVRDITERRKEESELRAAYEQISAFEEELRSQCSELARSEQQVREDEENFRLLVENIPDALYIADGDVFLYVNPAMVRLVKADSPADLLGRSLFDWIDPAFHNRVKERIRQVLDVDNSAPRTEITYRAKDGTPVPVESTIASFCYKGKTAGLVILRDIARRREAERMLREKEEQFREQYQNNPLAIFTWQHNNGDFVLIECNKAADRLTGGRARAFIGRSALDIYATRPWIAEDLLKVYSEHVVLKRENASEHFLPGATIRFVGMFVPPDLVMVHLEDITEQKHVEEALADNRRTLETLLYNLPGMAYRCRNDPDWTMEFVSLGCKNLTGYEPGDLVGNHILSYGSLIVPEDRQRVFDECQVAIKSRRPFKIEYRIADSAGRIRWVWEQGRGVFDSNGQLSALEGYITDNTAPRQAVEALHQANRNLNLLYGITRHDIVNQLHALDNFIELLKEKTPDPLLANYYTWIFQTTARISSLIRFTKEYEAIGNSEPVWQEIKKAVDAAAGDAPAQQHYDSKRGSLGGPGLCRSAHCQGLLHVYRQCDPVRRPGYPGPVLYGRT